MKLSLPALVALLVLSISNSASASQAPSSIMQQHSDPGAIGSRGGHAAFWDGGPGWVHGRAPNARKFSSAEFTAEQIEACQHVDPAVAIEACTHLIQRGSIPQERAAIYALRAQAYARQGDLDRARADYDRAAAGDNADFWIHANRGYLYFLAGDFKEALLSYDAAASLNPNDAAMLVNRALLLAAAPDEALRNSLQSLTDAQRANELEPGQPAYIDALAVAYASNGEFDRAAAEQQRAIDLLPRDNEDLIDDYRGRLDLYRQGTPFLIGPSPET